MGGFGGMSGIGGNPNLGAPMPTMSGAYGGFGTTPNMNASMTPMSGAYGDMMHSMGATPSGFMASMSAPMPPTSDGTGDSTIPTPTVQVTLDDEDKEEDGNNNDDEHGHEA